MLLSVRTIFFFFFPTAMVVKVKDAETKMKNSRICGRSGMKNLKKEGRERLQRRNDMEKEDLNY